MTDKDLQRALTDRCFCFPSVVSSQDTGLGLVIHSPSIDIGCCQGCSGSARTGCRQWGVSEPPPACALRAVGSVSSFAPVRGLRKDDWSTLPCALWTEEFRQRTLPRFLFAVSACVFSPHDGSSLCVPPSPALQVASPNSSASPKPLAAAVGWLHPKKSTRGDQRHQRDPPLNGRRGVPGRRRRDQLKKK